MAMAKANSVLGRTEVAAAWLEAEKEKVPKQLGLQLELIQAALGDVYNQAKIMPASKGIDKITQGMADGYENAIDLAMQAMLHAPKAAVDGFAALAGEMAKQGDGTKYTVLSSKAQALMDSVRDRRQSFHNKAKDTMGWLDTAYSESLSAGSLPEDPDFNKKLNRLMEGVAPMAIQTYENGLSKVKDDIVQSYAEALAVCTNTPSLVGGAPSEVLQGLTLYGDELVLRSKKHSARFGKMLKTLRSAVKNAPLPRRVETPKPDAMAAVRTAAGGTGSGAKATASPPQTKPAIKSKRAACSGRRRGLRVVERKGSEKQSPLATAMAKIADGLSVVVAEVEDAYTGCGIGPSLTAAIAGALTLVLIRFSKAM